MSTIRDIATEAGVSVMTVSNVINNNHARVSPATERRVREIMEKHNYVPNMAARSLISKSSRIIAVLLPIWHGSTASMLRDPYAGQLAGYLEELLREREYYVMLCSFERAEQVLMLQKTWQMDGMILILPHEDAVTRELIEKTQKPLVVIDRHYEDLPTLSVCLDDRGGGYRAAKYLLERGHRRIGFAAPSIFESSVLRDRYDGFREALGEYGLVPREDWLFDGVTHQAGGDRVAEAVCRMSDRPGAIVATEDLLACGIIKGCQDRGMQIPRDLSVIGFDDSMPARLITPELTTVAQNIREKADRSVRMLMRALEEPSFRDAHEVLDVSVKERRSVRPVKASGRDGDAGCGAKKEEKGKSKAKK